MTLDVLLSTILLVSFLVTIVLAIGSYIAYKLREGRRSGGDASHAPGARPLFERVLDPDQPDPAPGGKPRAP